ncbi:MAG: FG-GAP repeat domain-containing protein [Phycisphaerales bacterium]
MQTNLNSKAVRLACFAMASLIVLGGSTGCRKKNTPAPGPGQSEQSGEAHDVAPVEMTDEQPAPEHKGPTVETIYRDAPDDELRAEMALNDAGADGWAGEVLNSSSGSVLSGLFGPVLKGEEVTVAHVAERVTAGVSSTVLRPLDANEDLTGIDASGLSILRQAPGAAPAAESNGAGLLASMTDLLQPFDERIDLIKFKNVQSHATGETGTTEVLYLAAGKGKRGIIQQNATWLCTWDLSRGVENPLLASIEVSDFVEVSRSRYYFDECTEAVLGKTTSWPQMQRGLEYWWGKLDFGFGGTLSGHNGMAIGDIDNDRLDDIYVCQPGLLPNRLYRHLPDGTLTDISAQAGVDWLNDTTSALIVDLNNDGNQDLILGTVSHILIMRGDGQANFVPIARFPVVMIQAMAAADVDLDGDLDLYLCQYSATGVANSTTGPLYDSQQGLPNILLRNMGDFNFVDATAESGLGANNFRQSFACSFSDFDDDGDQDLYVANDFGANNLYRNDRGVFTDIAAQAGVEDQAAGMGVAWGDFNRDGRDDIFVTNMFSSAGNRVTRNEKFEPLGGEATADSLQYFSRGNSLFENLGGGTFRDVSVDAGITMGRFAWGAEFADFNNDGWLDVACPNGFITNHSSADL